MLPALVLPTGGGAIRSIGEQFSVNSITGTSSLTLPIAVSPGRSGFSPELALSYDSGAGNGPFGWGLRLSLAEITRQTDRGLPRYDDADESDVFLLSGLDDLVPVSDEGVCVRQIVDESIPYLVRRYRPRVEGAFMRIERWTDPRGISHWRTISANNITAIYGRDEAARVADPRDPTRVFRWLLEQSHDDRGNVIVYEYRPRTPSAWTARRRRSGTASPAAQRSQTATSSESSGAIASPSCARAGSSSWCSTMASTTSTPRRSSKSGPGRFVGTPSRPIGQGSRSVRTACVGER
ncbi:MAG: hypothetical protein HC927_00460 [Deltaproteobacteria bacterium]|nr:hypothetical protein [Deltaproteobacteria bacterium]